MDRDSDIPPDPSEGVKANSAMVDRVVKGIAVGMQTAIIPGQTSQADLLSAVFTVLWRMLDNAKQDADPEFEGKNAQEIGQVLVDLLLRFGPSSLVN